MDFAGENKISGFKRNHNKNESELSLRKQALFLMLNFRECYITSADAREINKIFWRGNPGDPIQHFNKWREEIQMVEEQGQYGVIFPYVISIKSKLRQPFDKSQKEKQVKAIQDAIKKDYIETIWENWDLGHKNPFDIDSGLLWQPPAINRSVRDRFIFIDITTRMPTPEEFQRLHNKGNLPYTEKQLKDLYVFLKSLGIKDD